MIFHDASLHALCSIFARLPASPARGALVSARRMAAGGYRWQNALIETGGRFFFCLGRLSAWRTMRMRPGARRVPPCRR